MISHRKQIHQCQFLGLNRGELIEIFRESRKIESAFSGHHLPSIDKSQGPKEAILCPLVDKQTSYHRDIENGGQGGVRHRRYLVAPDGSGKILQKDPVLQTLSGNTM